MKQKEIAKQKQLNIGSKHSKVSRNKMFKNALSTFICYSFVCGIALCITAPTQMKTTLKVKEIQKQKVIPKIIQQETTESILVNPKPTATPTQKSVRKEKLIISKNTNKMYTKTLLNLRKEPTTNSEVLTVIPQNEIITVRDTNQRNWCYVKYNKNSGYVNKKYLSNYTQEKYINIGLEYEYQDLVRELIKTFNFDVDEYFFYGMMYTENRFRQEPESSAGAQGILQILPSTWDSLLPLIQKQFPKLYSTLDKNSSNKRSNIIVGMYYIKYIRDYYGCSSVANNASKILTSYNRGTYNAKKYYEKHGTYRTSYSREILRAATYIRIHKTWKEGL